MYLFAVGPADAIKVRRLNSYKFNLIAKLVQRFYSFDCNCCLAAKSVRVWCITTALLMKWIL